MFEATIARFYFRPQGVADRVAHRQNVALPRHIGLHCDGTAPQSFDFTAELNCDSAIAMIMDGDLCPAPGQSPRYHATRLATCARDQSHFFI